MFHLTPTFESIFISFGCDVAVDFYCHSDSRYFLTGIRRSKVTSKTDDVAC